MGEVGLELAIKWLKPGEAQLLFLQFMVIISQALTQPHLVSKYKGPMCLDDDDSEISD